MSFSLIQKMPLTRPKTDIANDHILGQIKGSKSGPVVIFLGGVHGNEPAGVLALKQVIKDLNIDEVAVNGSIYAIAGNLKALAKKERYLKEDLNRIWRHEDVSSLPTKSLESLENEEREQKELWDTLNTILTDQTGPIYFMDIHTTSSSSIPFLTINDQLLNRAFCKQYPLPIILGMEEFITGPILSYINELGYVAFGFEAGQHQDLAAVQNAAAFVYLSLEFTGSISLPPSHKRKHFELLKKASNELDRFYEIYERYQIAPLESFKMLPNFYNFEHISEGQALAFSNELQLRAKEASIIFMPLYQGKGEDGYFLIRPIPKVFLALSKLLRKLKFDRILPILPGVSFDTKQKNSLLVNKRWAFLFRRQLLHLLGYRAKSIDKLYIRAKNREAASKKSIYKNTSWY